MRVVEFFESEDRRLSMSRLLCFMSFFPATVVVLRDGTEATLSWYLGSFVLGYIGGKGADVIASLKGDSNAGTSQ